MLSPADSLVDLTATLEAACHGATSLVDAVYSASCTGNTATVAVLNGGR
jgi:hypothetical protein